MARRNDHSREQLRDLAIQSVLNLVDHDAFISVTARAVTRDMGYTVGTLYLVFRNLDDLLVQVNAELLKRIHLDMQFAVKNAVDPQTTIFTLAKCYFSLAEQYPGRWQLLSRRHDKASDDGIDNIVEAIFILVENELTRLAPTRNSKEIALAARALWSAVHGICVVNASSHLRRQAHYDTRSLARTLIQTYLSGFMFDNIDRPRS
ncbi:MAG: TetR/AcrR family transcriptional regulator [Gammaproteobacteria bacterium]|nr:TetR/AcrR family transcriptional regulator [Gammaproteobacteria bacterium]